MKFYRNRALATVQQERGAALQTLCNLLFLLTLAFISIKMFGLYYDDWKIGKLFDSLATELPAKPHTEKDIEGRIRRQFELVDYISGIDIVNALTLKKKKGTSTVDFSFEKRVPFLGNLYLVGHFSYQLEYATPGRE